MTNLVHYLIKNPNKDGGLIYPTDIDDNMTYVGFGGFYLLGQRSSSIHETYRFHAIKDHQIIETELAVYQDSKNFFRVELSEIGHFLFFAQNIPKPSVYTGKQREAFDLVPLRRLRSWRPNDLERACLEHDFYFVGYTPRLGSSTG